MCARERERGRGIGQERERERGGERGGEISTLDSPLRRARAVLAFSFQVRSRILILNFSVARVASRELAGAQSARISVVQARAQRTLHPRARYNTFCLLYAHIVSLRKSFTYTSARIESRTTHGERASAQHAHCHGRCRGVQQHRRRRAAPVVRRRP